MLACWRVSVLAGWRVGVLAGWRVGVLAGWRVGVLACWQCGAEQSAGLSLLVWDCFVLRPRSDGVVAATGIGVAASAAQRVCGGLACWRIGGWEPQTELGEPTDSPPGRPNGAWGYQINHYICGAIGK